MQDKYTATWVSHSSMSDFLICPRAYYLKNVYKDPKTGHKVQVMRPQLALGQVVHSVLESLSAIARDERFSNSLPEAFKEEWKNVSGEKGGFLNEKQEQLYHNRGLDMMGIVYHNPGPLKELAVKIKQDLPQFWLSEEDNIILCGKIDWLEYLPDTDSVHIIDFKTGKSREDSGSLQLPIYCLLVNNCQERKVTKASYWHLEHDKICIEQTIPDLEEASSKILDIARKIKLARQLKKFDCPDGEDGCMACRDMEKIIEGRGKLVGYSGFRDIYVLNDEDNASGPKSEIL